MSGSGEQRTARERVLAFSEPDQSVDHDFNHYLVM